MIKYFFDFKIKRSLSLPPTHDDLINASKILFAIFTRYGDTIIDFIVIDEFIKKYPDKEYLILCPIQMEPYCKELLPEVECRAFNKRNLFELLKVIKILKKRAFDIGFNPWSNGNDSNYYLTYCKKFQFYKDFNKPKRVNHYQVIRKYLSLPEKNWQIKSIIKKRFYSKILICPQSTDPERSLSLVQLDKLIRRLKSDYENSEITIASMNENYFRKNTNRFIFNKSKGSSSAFLDLIKCNDLVICADSGPLHLAIALKKPLIAIFNSSNPKIVLNAGSEVEIL